MFRPEERARLVRYVASLIGDEGAEDVVQEYYLLQLSGKVPPFRGESRRQTWVRSILQRTAHEWCRREWKQPRSMHLNGSTPRVVPDYDTVLDVRRHLAALKFDDRDILHQVERDASCRSIAEDLGLTHGAVKTRIYRARRHLKARLV